MEGWDDPRMPTISGMRRRGYSPQGLRNFARNLGVSKTNGITEFENARVLHSRGFEQVARCA